MLRWTTRHARAAHVQPPRLLRSPGLENETETETTSTLARNADHPVVPVGATTADAVCRTVVHQENCARMSANACRGRQLMLWVFGPSSVFPLGCQASRGPLTPSVADRVDAGSNLAGEHWAPACRRSADLRQRYPEAGWGDTIPISWRHRGVARRTRLADLARVGHAM